MAKILLVDDSRLSRTIAKDALTLNDHVVVEAADGQQGLAALEEHRPDCVVLDLLMPRMDGHEFLRELRGRGATTPVIAVTADIQETSRALCEELGVSGFLSKPVKSSVLAACVEAAVTQSQEVVPCS